MFNFFNRGPKRGFEKINPEQFKKDFKDWIADDSFDITRCNLKMPKRATYRSAGYDIFSPVYFRLPPQRTIKVPTGLRAYMRNDEELDIRVRSSMGFKFEVQLLNAPALIDADYYMNEDNDGHIWLALKNNGVKDWVVNQGDAISQGTFHKYLTTDDDSPSKAKRKGGIGSTGN